MGAANLKPFISEESSAVVSKPIVYRSTTGGIAYTGHGLEAAVLPQICDVWLKARDAKALKAAQQSIAERADILVRGLAHTGIIALVDEATGYQADRARDALAKILEAFVAKELQKWVKTFPADFYQELFRLRNLPYNGSVKRPQYIGHLTNDLVYRRLAPGVLEELRRMIPKNEKGRRKGTLTQGLTPGFGVPRLREHIASVTTLMKASDTWELFMPMLDRALPPQVELPLFDNVNEKPPLQIGR